jgi:competence protein ComEA
MITVHVAGLVSRPGLVELPEGSRVADAVAAAGGLLPGARAEAINLAAALSDGQQIVVPEADGDRPATSAGTPDGKVHLNQATASELDSLPGVGPVIAERIVSYREENGPFETIEDLLDVPGIGEAKLADLRDHVQVP